VRTTHLTEDDRVSQLTRLVVLHRHTMRSSVTASFMDLAAEAAQQEGRTDDGLALHMLAHLSEGGRSREALDALYALVYQLADIEAREAG
jgi:hypothetical protein